MAGGSLLIVGLGNPGPEYERTRHNIGAVVLDILCERLGERLRPLKGVRAMTAEARDGDVRLILARPTTYMNESGEAVAPLARYHKVEPTDIVVVHDDLDLPLGAIRVKRGGGNAGHNGLKSVSRALKTPEYVRVRVGVGRPPGSQQGADYVLRPFGKREEEDAAIAAQRASDAALAIARDGLEAAQSVYNDKPERAPKQPARAVRKDVVVPATPEQVFDAFTTEEGARTFFAPDAHIELEVGGPYELWFDLDAPEGERGSEGCVVLAHERPRFVVFNWNAPPGIPTVRAGRKTRVEVRFDAAGAAEAADAADATDVGTRVRLTHTGWGRGPDWDEAFAYFDGAWDVVLERLRARFTSGPIDWPRAKRS
jgi:PTH1 family peptidyl-tRNA hydrolase